MNRGERGDSNNYSRATYYRSRSRTWPDACTRELFTKWVHTTTGIGVLSVEWQTRSERSQKGNSQSGKWEHKGTTGLPVVNWHTLINTRSLCRRLSTVADTRRHFAKPARNCTRYAIVFLRYCFPNFSYPFSPFLYLHTINYSSIHIYKHKLPFRAYTLPSNSRSPVLDFFLFSSPLRFVTVELRVNRLLK